MFWSLTAQLTMKGQDFKDNVSLLLWLQGILELSEEFSLRQSPLDFSSSINSVSTLKSGMFYE